MRILSDLSFPLLLALVLSPKAAFGAGPFGVNGDWDFVNVTNQITGWSPPAGSSNLPPLDSNGWPMGDASAVMFDERRNMPWRGPDSAAVNENISGTYLLSMTGQAVITGTTETGSGITVQNQLYDSSTNTTTAEIVYAPFHWLMQLYFANTQRTPADSPGTGFTNLVLLRPHQSEGIDSRSHDSRSWPSRPKLTHRRIQSGLFPEASRRSTGSIFARSPVRWPMAPRPGDL